MVNLNASDDAVPCEWVAEAILRRLGRLLLVLCERLVLPRAEEKKGVTMAFKVLFLAHAPDADKEKHRGIIATGMYELSSVVVRNQAEAIEVCRDFVEKENIDSVLLCPGFTHSDVAEIVRAVGKNVAVSVARGDGPSGRVSLEARKREGYPGKR